MVNARGGRNIDFSDEIRQRPFYDPDRHPDGLIDISGASNETMRDVLQEYSERYSRRLGLAESEFFRLKTLQEDFVCDT